MGNYNPDRPHLIGQEWVPIRNEEQQYSPRAHPAEIGHAFYIASTSSALLDGRFYLTDYPSASVGSEVFSCAVYPKNVADNSGPVQRIIIPCSAVVISGGALAVSLSPSAASALDAISDPSDEKYITINLTIVNSSTSLYFSFNTPLFSAITNKRILGVNMLYSVNDQWLIYNNEVAQVNLEAGSDSPPTYITLTNDGSFAGVTQVGIPYGVFKSVDPELGRTAFGEIDYFWSPTNPSGTTERLPYSFTGLAKFSHTATSTRVRVRIPAQSGLQSASVTDARINYIALEVFFCEEQRIAVGGRSFGGETSVSQPFTLGANKIPLRTMETYSTGVTIPAGENVITLSVMEPGDCELFTADADPQLNALRQLYSLSTHTGMKLNLPFPLDETAIGKQFLLEEVNILPQISLHISSDASPMIEPHVFGRQAVAQVYGSVTATQEVNIANVGIGASQYPQVRYYARRFGSTMIPLLLDSPTITGTGKSVQITPAEFDALPEIIDGWKEITLRFSSPPTFDSSSVITTTPQWRWSATGEAVGNRWEVLGASAISISGTPGNTLQLTTNVQRLSKATYGRENSIGDTVNLGWVPGISPIVSSTTDDESADAVLIFSTDPPTITGFSVSQQTQSLSTVSSNCPADVAACIPTGLLYNKITWDPVVVDNFNRTSVSGWGNADTGDPWTMVTGTGAVASGIATHTVTTNTTAQTAISGAGASDIEVYVETYAPAVVTAGTVGHQIMLRWGNSTQYDIGQVIFGTSNLASLNITRRDGSGFTSLSTVSSILSYTTNTVIAMKMKAHDRFLSFKAWRKDIDPEPGWMINVQDNTFLTSQGVGIRTEASAASAPSPWVASYMNFRAYPSTLSGGGAWELQRKDSYTGWQTIMSATDMSTWYFNDYEARVNDTSSYQMRIVDLYEFAGSWSATGTAAMAAPGVTGTGSDYGILIFTTNSVQDGSKNLAYASTWDFNVSEDFAWPEGSQFTFQQMYGKDFPTAFHQTERGGEQFSRSILVNAVAVPAVVSDGFEDLRDMSWEDVPYICVRDELGHVWYAAVLVPGGSRQRMNAGVDHLNVAAVSVIEVTDTPFPVDP